MKPRIETLKEKKLIGKQLRMSLSNNRTGELWRSFMQNRRSITNNIGSALYSMQIFDPAYFRNFNPAAEFQKWAAIEVADHNIVPDGMETVTLPEGLYAVFIHKGAASTGPQTFQYILGTWLPGSDYMLDNRPHFELLGEKYKNDDPASEEEIWIPIRPK